MRHPTDTLHKWFSLLFESLDGQLVPWNGYNFNFAIHEMSESEWVDEVSECWNSDIDRCKHRTAYLFKSFLFENSNLVFFRLVVVWKNDWPTRGRTTNRILEICVLFSFFGYSLCSIHIGRRTMDGVFLLNSHSSAQHHRLQWQPTNVRFAIDSICVICIAAFAMW